MKNASLVLRALVMVLTNGLRKSQASVPPVSPRAPREPGSMPHAGSSKVANVSWRGVPSVG